MEDVRTLKDVPADESSSSTDEEYVEEQQSDEVKPKLVPMTRYAVSEEYILHVICAVLCL